MKTSKHRFKIAVFIFSFFLLLGSSAYARVLYVDHDAAPGGDGRSWSTAFRDIQSAIDAASSRWMVCTAPKDQIWVKEGIYRLSSQIRVNRVVSILGGFNGTETRSRQRNWSRNQTIIDGLSKRRCLYITAFCYLNGFTIRNGKVGNNGKGGGIYVKKGQWYCASFDNYLSPSIVNCRILSNSAGTGGGMYIERSDPTIKNCTFSDNSSFSGGAIYHTNASPEIIRCTFNNNEATAEGSLGGGALAGFNANDTSENLAIINNCLFYDNESASWGGAISYSQVYPIITNCTFTRNAAVITGGGFYGSYDEGPKVINSIFWDNTPDELEMISPHSFLEVLFSNIEGGWSGPGRGNIDEDPEFVSTRNFSLRPYSPCVDSASNGYAPDDDRNGRSRPYDGDEDGTATADMGAFEYRPTIHPPYKKPAVKNAFVK